MANNSSDKIRVVIMQGGKPIGYIESMSYKHATFSITREKMFAKTYASQDSAMRDIDYATRFSFGSGYVFIMG